MVRVEYSDNSSDTYRDGESWIFTMGNIPTIDIVNNSGEVIASLLWAFSGIPIKRIFKTVAAS